MDKQRYSYLIIGGVGIFVVAIILSQVNIFENDVGRLINGTLMIVIRFLCMIWIYDATKSQARKTSPYIIFGLISPGLVMIILGLAGDNRSDK